jgi:hypothetical protein
MSFRIHCENFLSGAAVALAALFVVTHVGPQAWAGSQENSQNREASLRAFAAVASGANESALHQLSRTGRWAAAGR